MPTRDISHLRWVSRRRHQIINLYRGLRSNVNQTHISVIFVNYCSDLLTRRRVIIYRERRICPPSEEVLTRLCNRTPPEIRPEFFGIYLLKIEIRVIALTQYLRREIGNVAQMICPQDSLRGDSRLIVGLDWIGVEGQRVCPLGFALRHDPEALYNR
jgi:hypothetical protein